MVSGKVIVVMSQKICPASETEVSHGDVEGAALLHQKVDNLWNQTHYNEIGLRLLLYLYPL